MKIVVLDGFAANPGDLSWEGMKVLGNVQFMIVQLRKRY